MRKFIPAAVFLLLGSVGLQSCVEPLDITPNERESLTLGGEVFSELCSRLALQSNPKDIDGWVSRSFCRADAPVPSDASLDLQALVSERARLISAVDDALVAPLPEELDQVLRDFAPLYDSGQVQTVARSIADVLEAMANDPAVTEALSSMGGRQGYVPPEVAARIIRPLMGYDRLNPLLERSFEAFRTGGYAEAEWHNLLAAMEPTLRNADLSGVTTEIETLRRFVFMKRDAFSDGIPRYTVSRDQRAIAEPAGETPAEWRAGFVDTDFDAMADVDEFSRFVDSNGKALDIAAPFPTADEAPDVARDEFRRLKDASGRLVYDYIDGSKTLAGGLVAEIGNVMVESPQAALDLVYPFTALLGPEVTKLQAFDDGSSLEFQGYDLSGSPLMDLAYVGTKATTFENLRDTLELVRQSFVEDQAELGAVLVPVLDMLDDLAGDYEDVELATDNIMADDLLDVLAEIALEPDLLEALLVALSDPASEPLADFFGDYLYYRDWIGLDPQNPNGPPVVRNSQGSNTNFQYADLVNRSDSDTIGNQSIFQRLGHLIHDTKGARFCNKEGAYISMTVGGFLPFRWPLVGDYAECELFEIEDMSVFYVDALLGQASLEFKGAINGVLTVGGFVVNIDEELESNSGIVGFDRTPTQAAIDRLIFGERNDFMDLIIDAPLSSDGAPLETRHPDTIFAWEVPGFVDALQPILRTLDQFDRKDILPKLLSALHMHWATIESDSIQTTNSGATAFARGTGVVQFEEAIGDLVADGRILETLPQLLRKLLNKSVNGRPANVVLAEGLRDLLLPARNIGLESRSGGLVYEGDGATVYQRLSPAILLVDALRNLDDATVDAEDDIQRFSAAFRTIARQWVGLNQDASAFANPRAAALVEAALAFYIAELDSHRSAGDLEEWTQGLYEDLDDLLSDALTVRGLQLFDVLARNEGLRSEFELLLAYMTLSVSPNDALDATVATVVDGVQLLRDVARIQPVLQESAVLFGAEDGLVRSAVDLLGQAVEYDTGAALPRAILNLLNPREGAGESSFSALAEIVGKVNRVEPGLETPWSSEDYALTLRTAANFIRDEDRGLERLFSLLEQRNLP